MQNLINNKITAKFGLYISVITTILTVITFGIAICTPPLSGPFCTEGCFQYPYHEILSRFPRDYYWMFPAIFVSFSYLIMMNSIYHYYTSGKENIQFNRTGICTNQHNNPNTRLFCAGFIYTAKPASR